jgi:E-phenylitaconyl-CoA hydratase
MSVIVEVENGTATVTLNRPDAMNSIDAELRQQLLEVWQQIHRDDDIRVAILTGAGEKAFCTGSDLKKTMPPTESFAQTTFGRSESDHLLAGLTTDKPLICAINGYAMGGGLELALACDIRIASENAQFGLSEVRIGSIPGAGGTQRLPRAIGASNAMLMLLTGDRIDAAEALRVGLVSRVVAPADLLPAARAIASRIAQNAPLAVRAVKRLVRQGVDMPLDAAIETERYVFGLMRDTEDRIEGRRAFQEKRIPNYKGR